MAITERSARMKLLASVLVASLTVLFAVLVVPFAPQAIEAQTLSAPTMMTATVQVGQGGNNFSPPVQTVAVGDKVHWVWASSPHSTTSGTCCTPGGNWDSGVHSVGFTFDF